MEKVRGAFALEQTEPAADQPKEAQRRRGVSTDAD
jgi:hypothetical protein